MYGLIRERFHFCNFRTVVVFSYLIIYAPQAMSCLAVTPNHFVAADRLVFDNISMASEIGAESLLLQLYYTEGCFH